MLDAGLPRRSLYSGPDVERACESKQGYQSQYEVEEAMCDLIISARKVILSLGIERR